MPSNRKYDVFLSYAHPDAEIVEQIGARLVDEGRFRVWLDKWVLIPGADWQPAMARGLNQARTCAVCIGHQTPKGWFGQEIQRALNRQVRDNSFRVIPVILPEGDRGLVDNFLELRTWVDFKNGIKDQIAFHLLVSGIRGVPPGRNPTNIPTHIKEDNNNTLVIVREKLEDIRTLRDEQLIDDDIALEYQRRLLERLIGST
jgi:hypothetical protein